MSYLTHFCCESEQLGRYAILTQSPTHAKAIAEKIGAEAVSKGDLYHIYTGKVGRQAVSVNRLACRRACARGVVTLWHNDRTAHRYSAAACAEHKAGRCGHCYGRR